MSPLLSAYADALLARAALLVALEAGALKVHHLSVFSEATAAKALEKRAEIANLHDQIHALALVIAAHEACDTGDPDQIANAQARIQEWRA